MGFLAKAGFKEFNNFNLGENKEIRVRFQYDWTAHDRTLGIPFIGVGYLLLNISLHGFTNQR